MTIYIEIDSNNKVIQFLDSESIPEGTNIFIEVPEVLPWNPPTKTSDLYWVDNQAVWIETASLAELKVRKNEEINAARLAVNRSTFTYQGKLIACDELSRSDIDAINGIVAVTQSLPPNWVGGWKAVDNTYVVISTVLQWINFYGAMVAQGSSNFAHAQQLKATLLAAQDAAAVAQIKWAT